MRWCFVGVVGAATVLAACGARFTEADGPAAEPDAASAGSGGASGASSGTGSAGSSGTSSGSAPLDADVGDGAESVPDAGVIAHDAETTGDAGKPHDADGGSVDASGPLGEAYVACEAAQVGTCATQQIVCAVNDIESFVCATSAASCRCWGYAGAVAHHVRESTLTGGLCQCAQTNDPTW